jgi:hypothetical protein
MGDERTAAVVYEVHDMSDGDPPIDLGVRFTTAEFFEAVDFACEYLEEYDPHCEGGVSRLEVVKVQDGERTTMLTYRHEEAASVSKDPTAIWGFDVTLPWRGLGGLRTAVGPATR